MSKKGHSKVILLPWVSQIVFYVISSREIQTVNDILHRYSCQLSHGFLLFLILSPKRQSVFTTIHNLNALKFCVSFKDPLTVNIFDVSFYDTS